MLVLSRKAGERIVIGSNIVVTILEVRGNVIKIGCDAPPHVTVHREEVSRRIKGRRADGAKHPNESPFFAECA